MMGGGHGPYPGTLSGSTPEPDCWRPRCHHPVPRSHRAADCLWW